MNAIDLFCGAGGTSTGATQAGAKILAAEERVAACVGVGLRMDPDGSFWRVAIRRNGRLFSVVPHRAEELHRQGYLRLRVRDADGVARALAHRVVWVLANGPIPCGLQVNHRDGRKDNNDLSNLELVTPSENVRHSLDVLHVVRARGEGHPHAVFTEDIVRTIRTRAANGERTVALARSIGCSRSAILRVVRGDQWKHVK